MEHWGTIYVAPQRMECLLTMHYPYQFECNMPLISEHDEIRSWSSIRLSTENREAGYPTKEENVLRFETFGS